MDFNSDGLLDILINQKETPNPLIVALQTIDPETHAKQFNKLEKFDSFLSTMDVCNQPNATRKLTNPHYVHVTDLNNDCVPDIFLTTENNGYVQAELYL